MWPRSRALVLAMGVLLMACTVVRPITSGPTPVSIEEYLRTHPHATLRVVDSTGHARWFYDAVLRGDTLHGSRQSFLPREEITVPLSQIAEVGAQRFSAGRTGGLAGAVLAVVGVVALSAPKPVY
jgi:hypothetical protein